MPHPSRSLRRVEFRNCRSFPGLTTDRHQVLKAWIAAILWLIVICIESTAYLSAHNTSRFLFPLLHYLFGMNWEQFEPIHFFLRKGGHVFGYGLLSILLFPRVARNVTRSRKSALDFPLGHHRRARNRAGGQPRRVAPELHPLAHWHSPRRHPRHLRRNRRSDPGASLGEIVLAVRLEQEQHRRHRRQPRRKVKRHSRTTVLPRLARNQAGRQSGGARRRRSRRPSARPRTSRPTLSTTIAFSTGCVSA